MATIALFTLALVLAAYAWVARKERARSLVLVIGVAAWVAAIGVLGAAGALRRYDVRPPPMVIVLGVGFVLTFALARSRVGERLARVLPLAAIIGFQAFRLPLELVMHRAAAEGTMPAQMSFGGWNYDVLTGASAIVLAWLVSRGAAPRWLIQGWAVMSSVLLVVIMGVAIASTPVFAAFGSTPDRLNTWIGWFPFIWLPGVLVPAALFGQIVLVRRLRLDSVV